MAKELSSATDVGDIPSPNDFQRVDTPKGGETTSGAPQQSTLSDRFSDVAYTVKGIFSDHSEKLFAVIALIGYILVFNSGKIESWFDFWRFAASLPLVLVFYGVLLFGRFIGKKINKK